jgi:hypothetical protein
MPLATAFRLSFFVTLALSCSCLALAETFFLSWMGLFLAGTLALLATAYRLEERRLLSADAANRLGMVIAIAAAFWILYKLPRSEDDLAAAGVPWPAGLLPHLGPLLILLLLVKLFRPKRMADYWVIQTIGLMMVTLGCVLAAEALFGVLLVLYLAGLLWSLALFYLVREEARSRFKDADKLSLFSALGDAPPPTLPWRGLGLRRVSGWTATVVLFGLVLFVAAPRQDNYQWEPKQLTSAAKGKIKTGFDSGMDLNQVGKIEISDDPAFEVQARDAKGPKLDLSADTRWFMEVLDFYMLGRWTAWGHGGTPPHLTLGISPKPDPLAVAGDEGWAHPRDLPADLADKEYYLAFKVPLGSAGGLPLAEPITESFTAPSPPRLRVGLYPHLGDRPMEASIFFHQAETDTIMSSIHVSRGRRRVYQYGQIVHPLENSNAVRAKKVNPRYRQFLVNQDVPESIAAWVRALLPTLPELSEADRKLDGSGRIPPASHAKVAQALTRYLAFSGEFGYSLDLRRRYMDVDPLADFLLNVKEGHCERYAGGLALMLRSLGIPARVAKGYRGADNLDGGHYLVRQRQAHSWVQVLVGENPQADWLTLDPTPLSERANKPLLSWLGWLFSGWFDGDNLWRGFIMEYNADSQRRTVDLVQKGLSLDDPWAFLRPLLTLGFLLACAFIALRLRRRWSRRRVPAALGGDLARADVGPGFYPKFLDVVHRLLNVQPAPGQTPREFGLLTGERLQNQTQDATCAAVPLRLISLLYRVRFGGQTPTDSEERQALLDVEMLENLLQSQARAG